MNNHSKHITQFIGIGPGRSGSTFLYEVFKTHPEIQMAKHTKEINYFNNNYNKGMDWYWQFFAESDANSKAKGEISNMYIYLPIVADRIKKNIPKAKIFSILRDPIQRIQSLILFRQRTGQIPLAMCMDDVLEKYPEIIYDNQYGRLLTPYVEKFNKEQIFIGNYSDIKNNTKKFMHDIFTFLGVDAEYKPSIIHKKINPTSFPRIKLFSTMIRTGADYLRRFEIYPVLSMLKRSKILNMVLYKQNSNSTLPGLSENSKRNIVQYLIQDIKILERKCGQNFSDWYDNYI